jgi:hypothetical protein
VLAYAQVCNHDLIVPEVLLVDELVDAIVKQALDIDPGFKGAPKPPVGDPLLKSCAVEEKRFVLGVAHPAGWSDRIKKGLDGHRDWMSADTVEKAAWGHLTEGRQIGLRHRDGTVGAAQVVESYIWRGPDWAVTDTCGTTQVIKSGDWVLGAILDEPTWQMYKAGEFTGWSVQGAGVRRPVIAKSENDEEGIR